MVSLAAMTHRDYSSGIVSMDYVEWSATIDMLKTITSHLRILKGDNLEQSIGSQ